MTSTAISGPTPSTLAGFFFGQYSGWERCSPAAPLHPKRGKSSASRLHGSRRLPSHKATCMRVECTDKWLDRVLDLHSAKRAESSVTQRPYPDELDPSAGRLSVSGHDGSDLHMSPHFSLLQHANARLDAERHVHRALRRSALPVASYPSPLVPEDPPRAGQVREKPADRWSAAQGTLLACRRSPPQATAPPEFPSPPGKATRCRRF